jgi:arylsulfatase
MMVNEGAPLLAENPYWTLYRKQFEGRSLVPLLENPASEWPERTLFTHVGRWNKDASPETGKYANCSVRTPQYHLVSISKQNKPEWMLFDVQKDHAEQQDIAAANPEIVTRLQASYEKWWPEVVPMMVNEGAPLLAENPYWTLYRKQFDGRSLGPLLETPKKTRLPKNAAPSTANNWADVVLLNPQAEVHAYRAERRRKSKSRSFRKGFKSRRY